VEWWPCRGAHSHYSPTRPGRYMCYAWGEGGSAFHFRALPTEEMKKEHALINSGGCAKLATCLLSSSFCLEMPFIIFSFFASAPAHYTCAFIPTCVKTWPTPRSSHTPQAMLAPRRHTLFLSFAAHSLHPPSPLSSHVHSMAKRLSLRPRPTVAPPPWSSSWRQARTRTRRAR